MYSEGEMKGLSVAQHSVDGTRNSVPTWMSELHNREKEKKKTSSEILDRGVDSSFSYHTM